MTLASNLRENKAIYAVAGAGDLAVEKLREVPEQMNKYQYRARETATKYQGEVRETVDRYREQVREAIERYRSEVSRYQERVDTKDLPAAAVAYAAHFGTRAVEFIDELAERGKKVVHREAIEVAELTEAEEAGTRTDAAAKTRNSTARKSAQPKARSTTRKTNA